MNINESSLSKNKVINDLNNIVNSNHGTLVKVSIDTDDYKNKKDIILFGSDMPNTDTIITNDNNIKWLDSELTGKLISSENIGSRPVYGTYAFSGTEKFKDDLKKWASVNNVSLSIF